MTFEGPSGAIAKPFWRFRPRGETGKMVSDLLPHLAEQVDEFCFFHALTTETSAHPQGENFFNTGFTMEGFPSFGAWVTYALGSENQELPAFVAINDPRGLARSGKNNFGNGFLPAAFQGTDFSAKSPPSNLHRPKLLTADYDRRTNDLLQRLNAAASGSLSGRRRPRRTDRQLRTGRPHANVDPRCDGPVGRIGEHSRSVRGRRGLEATR